MPLRCRRTAQAPCSIQPRLYSVAPSPSSCPLPRTRPPARLSPRRAPRPRPALQARAPAAQQLLRELTEAGSFYATPAGSNDDWYWIYASVTAGERGLLVSNDEMRDHIFQVGGGGT